jgi:PAS domain S-box-containing protein
LNVAPAYYQTYWFRVLCIAVSIALLWGVYQMRVHQLQEQEKKFRDAVETMPALAFVADPKGNRTFMNKGWLEYTGLSREEASGWEKTIHPDDLNRITGRLRASERTGQPLDYEARLRRGSDGVYRWFLIRAVPVRDKRGNIVKWCGAATDIEDRKRAEQLQADLTHISRVNAMGELVASISHELAQPIMASTVNAKASLRWLQHDPPELTEARKGTEKIIEAGALASEIINRLRSLYKKAPPKQELVALHTVIPSPLHQEWTTCEANLRVSWFCRLEFRSLRSNWPWPFCSWSLSAPSPGQERAIALTPPRSILRWTLKPSGFPSSRVRISALRGYPAPKASLKLGFRISFRTTRGLFGSEHGTA